jgi:DNA-binding helix-hairpin-helix protein with protein kinase domain
MNAQGKPLVATGAGIVPLGAQLGSGGEGAVYELVGRGDMVAKIYHKPVGGEKAEKLAAMAAMRDDRLRAVTAWPTEVLTTPGGDACGFLMPRLSGYKDIHLLYGPRSRRTEFPTAEFRFLLRAASNTARAFAAVHGAGCVVGDVNHGGIAVSPQATVKLLDFDSFQVSARGRPFSCDVGTPLYTPPEMQGRSFRGVFRQPNHDGFGLAVILFHLLFAGRHPFAGRFLGRGDMTIEQAITEFRFAYGHTRSSAQMEPPPGVPPLEAASAPIALLFERAFSREGANGLRPRADEWVSALQALERQTRQCSSNASHHYPSGLPSCPWCKVEAATGVALFGIASQPPAAGGGIFDIRAAWAAVTAVPAPGPPSNPADRSRIGGVVPSREAQEAARSADARYFWTIAIIAVTIAVMAAVPAGSLIWLLGGGIAAAITNKKPDTQFGQRVRSSLNTANAQLRTLEERWQSEASDAKFVARISQLEATKQTWQDLNNERHRRLRMLEQQREASQRRAFLDRFKLEHATIPGIGPGRKAMLASYNVETAADIEHGRISKIPGFGPALIGSLRTWHAKVEAKFRFDPSKGVDPQEIAALDREIAVKRAALERDILNGPADLKRLAHEISIVRSALEPQITNALRLVMQAEADLKAVGGR